MKCPECDQVTIGFGDWCKSPNAFMWQCPHCGTLLKASRATWRWFGLALVMLVPILGGIIGLEEGRMIAPGSGKLYVLVGVLVLIGPFAYVAYKRGGYQRR